MLGKHQAPSLNWGCLICHKDLLTVKKKKACFEFWFSEDGKLSEVQISPCSAHILGTGTPTRRVSAWTCCVTATTSPSQSSSRWWSSGMHCGMLLRCGPSSGCRGRWRSSRTSWTISTTTWPGPRLRRDRVGAWWPEMHPREDSELLPCEFDTLRQTVQFKLVHWVALQSKGLGTRLAMSLKVLEDWVHYQTSPEVSDRLKPFLSSRTVISWSFSVWDEYWLSPRSFQSTITWDSLI